MTSKMLEVLVLGVVSAALCGLAFVADSVFATVVFALQTCQIALVVATLIRFGEDVYWP